VGELALLRAKTKTHLATGERSFTKYGFADFCSRHLVDYVQPDVCHAGGILELKKIGLWTDEIRQKIKLSEGSIRNIAEIPNELREVYRTAWEIPMRSLIDMAADRGAFIDQSASLNLFMESPNIGKMSSMYMYAWQKGLKTTYYLRSRPATKINQVSAGETAAAATPDVKAYTDEEALVCSLENPESCEACQ